MYSDCTFYACVFATTVSTESKVSMYIYKYMNISIYICTFILHTCICALTTRPLAMYGVWCAGNDDERAILRGRGAMGHREELDAF